MSVYAPDDMHKAFGFTVEITGVGGAGKDVDSDWETVSGGSLNIEVADSSVGGDQVHTSTPGHKYVDTLTLRGALTGGRKAVCDWFSATVKGEDSRRTLTITELDSKGAALKQYIYHECFPTRYVFPAFSATGTGNLYEEMSCKPIRLDLA
jgi:phage tail-like protein